MALSDDLQMPRCCGIDIEEASIPDLQEHMTTGRITSAQLTECYLQRIKLVNPYTRSLESHLFAWSYLLKRRRSVIEENPDALSIARLLDAERAENGGRGPLHGIPFLVKDVFLFITFTEVSIFFYLLD